MTCDREALPHAEAVSRNECEMMRPEEAAQGREDETNRSSRSDQTGGAVLWCLSCGIPHPPGATHCSHCGKPLAVDSPVGSAADTPPALAPAVESDNGPGPLPLPEPVLAKPAPFRPTPTSLAARIGGRRSAPMDDAAIEAAAAAIVARAMAEERATDASSLGPAGESAVAGAAWPDRLPPPPREAPVPSGLPDKDRAWLIAGLVLCVLLIVFAVALSRQFSGV